MGKHSEKRQSRVSKRGKRAIAAQNRWKKVKIDLDTSCIKSTVLRLDNHCLNPNLKDTPCAQINNSNANKGDKTSTIFNGELQLLQAWGTDEEYKSISEHKLCIEVDRTKDGIPSILTGNRIVEIDYVLNWAINLQYEHAKICTLGKLSPIREECYGLGLVSKIVFKCNMCEKEVTHMTQDPNKSQSSINIGAVWGTLSTSSTYGHLKEFLSIANIPSMSHYTYAKIEQELSNIWKDELWEEMERAGKEELSIAVAKNQVDENNIPWIRVNLDGGWSKRLYGHNYNAASGAVVIIGNTTGKILFLGARNKFCSICARAANKNNKPIEHNCYRNWLGSSSAMEADIIVEGFNNSEEMHGLRYLEFIGDGDSSVFSKIRENVSYGRNANKIDCVNHAVKNYGKHLYKIKDDKNISVSDRKWLTTNHIKEFQKIAILSLNFNKNGNVENLKNDLKNGQIHIFGNHKNCQTYFCSQIGQTDRNDEIQSNPLFIHVNSALNSLLKHSSKLIANESNNKSECFMSILAKVNAGKRLNLIQRCSFQMRTCLSGLQYNNSCNWYSKPWKKIAKRSPGKHFKKFISQRSKISKARRNLNLAYRKAKPIKSTIPDLDYGPNSETSIRK